MNFFRKTNVLFLIVMMLSCVTSSFAMQHGQLPGAVEESPFSPTSNSPARLTVSQQNPKRVYDFYADTGPFARLSQYNLHQGARNQMAPLFEGQWKDFFIKVKTELAQLDTADDMEGYSPSGSPSFFMRHPLVSYFIIERLLELPILDDDTSDTRMRDVFYFYLMFMVRLTYDAMIIRMVDPGLYLKNEIIKRSDALKDHLNKKIRKYFSKREFSVDGNAFVEFAHTYFTEQSKFTLFYSARWLLSFDGYSWFASDFKLNNETQKTYDRWNAFVTTQQDFVEPDGTCLNIISNLFEVLGNRRESHLYQQFLENSNAEPDFNALDWRWLMAVDLVKAVEKEMKLEPLDAGCGCCC